MTRQPPRTADDSTEQAERREMFSFHPEILGEAGEPPRRIDATVSAHADRRDQVDDVTRRR